MDNFEITKATESDIDEIIAYLEEYRLDTANAYPEQFLVAKIDDKIVGFGRIKEYKECKELFELCSVGVVNEYRNSGIGTEIINSLLEKSHANKIWLTTKFPEYFKRFGFEVNDNVPLEIINKCYRVCSDVYESIEGSYFMVLDKNISQS